MFGEFWNLDWLSGDENISMTSTMTIQQFFCRTAPTGPDPILWLFRLVRKHNLDINAVYCGVLIFILGPSACSEAANTIDKETNGPALQTLTALQSLLKSLLSASVHRAPESGLWAELCVVYTAGR